MNLALVALGVLALFTLGPGDAPAVAPPAPAKPPVKPSDPTPKPPADLPWTPPQPLPDFPQPAANVGAVLLVGDEHAALLAAPLAAALGTAAAPSAVPGTDTVFWATLAGPPIVAATAGIVPGSGALVLVSLGQYDGASQVASHEALRMRVQAILAAVKARAQVAWILPPKGVDPFGAHYVIRDVLAAAGVPAFESDAYVIARAPDMRPTPAGYADWAAALALWLKGKGLR